MRDDDERMFGMRKRSRERSQIMAEIGVEQMLALALGKPPRAICKADRPTWRGIECAVCGEYFRPGIIIRVEVDEDQITTAYVKCLHCHSLNEFGFTVPIKE